MAKSIAYVLSRNTYPDAFQANLIGVNQGTQIVYATTSTLSSANVLFADSRLTQPIYGDGTSWYGVQLLTNTSVVYPITISESGVIAIGSGTTTTTAAPTTTTTTAPTTTTTTTAPTTTTTTTAAAPVAYSVTTNGVSSSQGDACIAISEAPVTTVYGSSNPLTVTAFYTNPELTTLFTGDGLNFFYGYHLNSAPSVNYSCEISLGGNVLTQTAC
jgi:hypothetical protein